MGDMLFLFGVGVLSLTVAMAMATMAFNVYQRRGSEYKRYLDRLPLAVRFEDLEDRVAELESERDALQEDVAAGQRTIEEAAEERRWLEENRDSIARAHEARQELERVEQELANELENLSGVKGEIDEKLERKKELEFETQKLQQVAEEARKAAEEAEARQHQAESSVSQLQDEVAELELKRDELQQELRDLGDSIANARSQRQEIQSEIERLQEEQDWLEAGLKELKNREQTLDQTVRELENKERALQGSIDGLDTKRQQLQELVEHMEDLLPRRSSEVVLDALWEPAIPIDEFSEMEASVRDEGQSLERVFAHLEERGLYFPRRVVHAFHTSLKVSVETPLLVLAGISGTGKSLLPQVYGQAMGIHVLPIAVQPRWDGPQDLLGFLNYLENTYKPTELLRALIQMDPINRRWYSDEIDPARDHMLIVLLDEMNLARVEYYFSEFLSRLEARREVASLSDQDDRRKAEILLDLAGGSHLTSGEDDDVRHDVGRLMVWNNVLFVGTMNEDESTLALSDKVVDRANVMRFGRPPKQAVGRSTDTDNARRHTADGWLASRTWRSWIEAGQQTRLPALVGETIERLNDALGVIGRPFGYRLQRAIEAYVRQYPESGDAAVRLALADQVEQRIMPKLRGLDVSDPDGAKALDGVLEVVSGLGDRALQDAIEMGRQAHGGHLFTWMGVQRSLDD